MQGYELFLVKVGEILLKLGNRREFENRLRNEIDSRLSGVRHFIEYTPGRFLVGVAGDRSGEAESILARMPGINGYARTRRTEKKITTITAAAVAVAEIEVAAGKRSFKVESRRSDKSFPLDSFELSRDLGSSILDAHPGLRVDLNHPEFTVYVEIREKAYVYANPARGLRGLPVGTQGRGLLLLSGGIDSPVAGYLMARRGLALDALYFHAFPYTSKEAHDKVKDLARVLAGFSGGLTLWTVPFTEVQHAIKKGAREDITTLMMRAAMMEIANSLALRRKDNCIVTGESLGQVASQTAENLRLTQFPTDLPVLRPLVGMDKEDTIILAKRIGTYGISIRPFEDCCVIFSPAHPMLKARLERERQSYADLALGPLLVTALDRAERMDIPFSERLPGNNDR
jgi:thiamine biosynthesis protein ThiI